MLRIGALSWKKVNPQINEKPAAMGRGEPLQRHMDKTMDILVLDYQRCFESSFYRRYHYLPNHGTYDGIFCSFICNSRTKTERVGKGMIVIGV